MCYFGRTAGGGASRIVAMSNIVSGRQIRAARVLAGLTQAELARAAGCHPRSVRYWENKGSNPPTNDTRNSIALIELLFAAEGQITDVIFVTTAHQLKCQKT
jgi:transcriptional regulator with XRE-family HTH domain